MWPAGGRHATCAALGRTALGSCGLSCPLPPPPCHEVTPMSLPTPPVAGGTPPPPPPTPRQPPPPPPPLSMDPPAGNKKDRPLLNGPDRKHPAAALSNTPVYCPQCGGRLEQYPPVYCPQCGRANQTTLRLPIWGTGSDLEVLLRVYGRVLARRARAGHLFLTIPHPCLPLHPPSPNNLEYLLAVSKNLAHPLHPVYEDGKGGGWKWWEWQISIAGATSDMYRCDVSVVATALYRSVMPNGNRPVLARPLPSGKKQRKTSLCSQKRSPMLRLLPNLVFLPVEYFSDAGGGGGWAGD